VDRRSLRSSGCENLALPAWLRVVAQGLYFLGEIVVIV
jgi:hypothetical protein